MSGEYGPSQGDTDFKAPKEEPKPEEGGKNTELDKDKIYEGLFTVLDAIKNLRDFKNVDPKLISRLTELIKDRGKLYGYDNRERELPGKIKDMFAELYKRGDEIGKEEVMESENHIDFMYELGKRFI